jgi:ketosteroid isomerase-like protein
MSEEELMSEEEQLIKNFYTCFQRLDWKGMLDCYTGDVFFYDPVFEDLDAPRVRAMWEMLLSRAKDLELSFCEVASEAGYGSCRWTATYTFTATGRKVVNSAKARFTIRDGKIAEHQDEFSFWKWSRQALGLPGMLLGWTSLLQNKVRRDARKSLTKFIAGKAKV